MILGVLFWVIAVVFAVGGKPAFLAVYLGIGTVFFAIGMARARKKAQSAQGSAGQPPPSPASRPGESSGAR